MQLNTLLLQITTWETHCRGRVKLELFKNFRYSTLRTHICLEFSICVGKFITSTCSNNNTYKNMKIPPKVVTHYSIHSNHP